MIKKLHAMQQTHIQSLDWEDPLEKEMATDFSILTWEVPWTEEPGVLQSWGQKSVECNWATSTFTFFHLSPTCPKQPLANIKEVSLLLCTYSSGVGMCLRRGALDTATRSGFRGPSVPRTGRHHGDWVCGHCQHTPFRMALPLQPAQSSSDREKEERRMPGGARSEERWAGNGRCQRASPPRARSAPHPALGLLLACGPLEALAVGVVGFCSRLPSVFSAGVCGKHSTVIPKAGLGPGASAARLKPGVYAVVRLNSARAPGPDPLFKNSPDSHSSWGLAQYFSKEANQQVTPSRTQATSWSLSQNGCSRQDEGTGHPLGGVWGEPRRSCTWITLAISASPFPASLLAWSLHSAFPRGRLPQHPSTFNRTILEIIRFLNSVGYSSHELRYPRDTAEVSVRCTGHAGCKEDQAVISLFHLLLRASRVINFMHLLWSLQTYM